MNKLKYYQERARLSELTVSALPCKIENPETKNALDNLLAFQVKNEGREDLEYYKEYCKLSEAVVHIAPCNQRNNPSVKKNFNRWQEFVFANKKYR